MHRLQRFTIEAILNKHTENCIVINGEQAIKMPQKGETVKFQNYQRQLQAPFVIPADFEAITEKRSGCTPNNSDSFTKAQKSECTLIVVGV